jgi:hypothetical protein
MLMGGIWNADGAPEAGHFDHVSRGLCLQYGRAGHVFEDDGELLVIEGQLYDAGPAQFLADRRVLDTAYGLYGYVRYDKASGDLVIGTDRLGYFPLYYAFDGKRLVFGATLAFVKRRIENRTPDYEAWEELMALGEVIGDKSTVKEIRRLAPGTRIHIAAGRMKLVRYWQPEIPDPVDEATAIRENNALLHEAVRLTAASPGRKAVLLSGGEDSRRIALAAVHAGLPVTFYTQMSIYKGRYRRYVDRDIKLATRVAALLDRPHVVEPMPDDHQYLADWRARDEALGFECIAHEWLLPLARRIPAGSLVYDGIVGDVTINGHYFKEFPQVAENWDAAALARMIAGTSSAAWLDGLRRRTESPLSERIERLLASYPSSPHRLTLYMVLNHTRRKIACVAQLFAMHGHWTCYPFLYYPLFVQSLCFEPRLQVKTFYQRVCMAALGGAATSLPTTRGRLSEEWLIPLDRESRRKDAFLLRHLEVSDEALEYFPQLRTSYRAIRRLRHFNGALLRRYGWFIPTIARFSAFLEWLHTDDGRYPVAASEPPKETRHDGYRPSRVTG